MIQLTTNQTLYIVLASISLIVVFILLFVLLYRKFYERTHIRELTYLRLSRICEKNDYLLLNQFQIPIDDKNKGVIDHIVISNKYIIIINCFSISGVLSGDYRSEGLLNTTRKGTNVVANPINYNINLTKRLCLFNDLDHTLIKGLVVINNDSLIKLENINKQFQVIARKDLAKKIKEFDQENVKNLKEESVVKFINYLNERNGL